MSSSGNTNHGERVRCVTRSFFGGCVVPLEHETDGQSEIGAKDVDEHRSSDIRNLHANFPQSKLVVNKTLDVYQLISRDKSRDRGARCQQR